ncbi:MAG: hypothetical protein AABZ10_04750 [Nitrospirota bacterium]
MDTQSKRRSNEEKFTNWIELPEGGRRYFFEVKGKHGWSAKYIKEVDSNEETTRFCQEIYNAKGTLVEIHEKYPEDKGHRVIGEE